MRDFAVLTCEQRTPEWFAARLGRLTGSTASDMLAKTAKGEPTTARRNLCVRLVLERLTGKSQEKGYRSAAMLAGEETEPEAVLAYEALTGRLVERTGFLQHLTLAAGTSLDGHVGDFDGIVEAKCPIPATHLDYLRTGRVPLDYMRQLTHSLWVSGAEWCDWFSYQPAFPESLQTKLVRVWAKDLDLAGYEAEARKFLAEVDAAVLEVQKLEQGAA